MRIKYPIIVEGKYDKIKLDSILDARIITTGGFEIFNDKEKELLLRTLAKKSRLIVLTDSDGAGELIRSHIKTLLPADTLINLYIPRIEGKEKRKRAPSKEGVLGVEGIDKERLLEMLSPFSEDATEKKAGGITKALLYRYGLSGREDSAKNREALLKKIGLPTKMSSNAMLCALNILYTDEELCQLMEK